MIDIALPWYVAGVLAAFTLGMITAALLFALLAEIGTRRQRQDDERRIRELAEER